MPYLFCFFGAIVNKGQIKWTLLRIDNSIYHQLSTNLHALPCQKAERTGLMSSLALLFGLQAPERRGLFHEKAASEAVPV